MATLNLEINSIFAGQSPSQYYGADGAYNSSIAIDPDYPIPSGVKASGFCVPIGASVISTPTNVNDEVIAIITTPKNSNIYAVTVSGKLISYSSSLGSETVIGTVTGSQAHGALYYNNYIYILGTGASGTDVSRYGPLTSSPALTNGVWTGATLGSLTALTNTTYPTLRNVSIPNHWGFVHFDSVYFFDFKNGIGMVHKIKTTKTTQEGDTNDGSAYNVLDLPLGWYPVAGCSFGTDIAVIAIQTTDTTINQGRAAMFLWNTTDSSFYKQSFLPDPIATAIINDNGTLKIWCGNAVSGTRLVYYAGGDSFPDLAFDEEGTPPIAGAVEINGGRVMWGSWTTYPATTASVKAYGSKNSRLPKGVHNIFRTTSAGSTPTVTAIKLAQQTDNKTPQILVAWSDGSSQGIDKYSATATLNTSIRWMFNIGKPFQIKEIRIPLGGAVAANTTITTNIYIDDASSTVTPTVINNTNYPSNRKIIYKQEELKSAVGADNFILEIANTGTNPLPTALPINIQVEVFPDEQ